MPVLTTPSNTVLFAQPALTPQALAAALTALLATLPTSPAATSKALWNNGGVIEQTP